MRRADFRSFFLLATSKWRYSYVCCPARMYHPPSMDALVRAQTLFQSSKIDENESSKLTSSIKDFAEFFCYTPEREKSDAKKRHGSSKQQQLLEVCQNMVTETVKRGEELEMNHNDQVPSMLDKAVTEPKELPVFIAAYDTSTSPSRIHLFSVTSNVMVGTYTIKEIQEDFWEQSGLLLNHVPNVSRRFILLPLVQRKEERKRLVTPVQLLVKALKSCGIQPLASVDTLVLEEFIAVKGGTSSSTATELFAQDGSVGIKEPVTATTFERYWSYLCAKLCQAVEEDPLTIVNTYVAPQYDVLVVHVVRTGSQGISISMWNPVKKKRYTAKGMLSDVLACLLQTGSSAMILLPTARTDRMLLYQCRTAMMKVGKSCVLCYGTDLHEKCRAIFHSDPMKLWCSFVEVFQSLEADLLFRTYECAGKTLREYYKKMWSEEGVQSYVERHVTADMLPTQSDVREWRKVFHMPQRVVTEVKEAKRYQRFLVIAYTCTEFTVFCQPRNPVASVNYIISAAITDFEGRLLQPWAKYTGRNENGFRLPSLDGIDVLVAYDAKHFMLLCNGDKELDKFIRRGGRVWCIMLAEYLLDAQRCHTGNNTLHDITLRYGIILPPAGKIGVGPETHSLAFHRRHLLSAAPAVQKIFLMQLRRAQEQMQMVSVAHRMDSLLAMVHMERNGICVDAEEADRQSNDLKNALVVMDHTLKAYVPTEVPADLRQLFDWTSPNHLHALLFGGVIQIGDFAMHRARETLGWSSNLMHLLYTFSKFDRLNGEAQLSRYASLAAMPSTNTNTKLCVRIGKKLDKDEKNKEKKFRIIVFDVETTGLNACTDEIIEVALYDPVEDKSFCSLVRPQRRITPRTIGIHHITEEEVQTAPTPNAVMQGVVKFLRLDPSHRDPNEILVLIGHNVFSLDEPMLRRAIDRFTGDRSLTDGILFCDSLTMLRGLKMNLQRKHGKKKGRRTSRRLDRRVLEALTDSLRLSKLMESLGVVAEGELHRAETDTRALWHVLTDAFGLSKRKPEEQCIEILTQAANSFFKFPSVGCFVPHMRTSTATQVTLSGIAKQHVDSPRILNSLRRKALSDEVLLTLHAHGVELAGLLLKRQRLERMAPRFLDTHADGQSSTLHPDCRIRQHIDMTSTVTSRTSSAYPSCQNISKDGPTRRLFVSRFGADGRCVEVDYSQLEIVVLAILSGDPKLVHDLKNGIDFHIKRAEFFSGVPYKQIEEGYHRGVTKYVKLRKMAKQFSFQRLYGAGVSLLHKTTGISIKDLQQSIDMEEKEYPGISEFYRAVRAVALRPNNPGLPTGYIVELPTGCRIHYKTRDVVLNLPPVKNYPIQAYGAELSQIMLGQLFRHFLRKEFYKNRAFIVNFVHDSVWLDCHKDVLQDCVKATCQIMSSVHEYVPKVFPGVQIKLPLNVTASCGINMHAMEPLKFSVTSSGKRSSSKR